MESELDVYTAASGVIRRFGIRLAAVKYALRMKRLLTTKGNYEGAAEWQGFAMSLLRRIKSKKPPTLH